MARYGMVIDLSKCMGCRACMEACKIENGTPASHFFMSVFRFEESEYPNTKVRFLPRPCNHCENPPCVAACPYDARINWKDGLVLTDVDNCRGTRLCEKACPYGVNYFNAANPEKNQYLAWDNENIKETLGGAVPPYWNPELDKAYSSPQDPNGKAARRVAGSGHRSNTVGKCTFCVHRLEKGVIQTACAQVCPVGAIKFGDLDDTGSEVYQLSRRTDAFRLKEEAGTSPKVFYLGQYPADDSRLIEKVPVAQDVQILGKPEHDGAIIPWK